MHMQEKRRESERQRWEREVREGGGEGEEIFLFLVIYSSHSNAHWQKYFDLRGQNIHHQAIPFEIKTLFYI